MVVKQQLKMAYRADTIEQLAELTGIDSANLLATVEQYNACARGEQQDPFKKSPADMSVIAKPPFYAIDLAAGGSPALSLGGLAVDEYSGQVKTLKGIGIEGLYAAGRTAVGIASNNYVSGLSIADGVFSGRRAGASAAKL